MLKLNVSGFRNVKENDFLDRRVEKQPEWAFHRSRYLTGLK